MNENSSYSLKDTGNSKDRVPLQSGMLVFYGRSAKVKTPIISLIILSLIILLPEAFFFFNSFRMIHNSYLPLVLSSVFLVLGLLFILLMAFKKTAEFDFMRGVFYPKGQGSDEILFSQLSCLEITRTVYNRHTTYNLEAVLKDGSRHRILSLSNVDRLKSDAEELSSRMSVPLKLDESLNVGANRQSQPTKGTFVFLIIFGLILLVSSGFIFWNCFGRPLWLCHQSARWIECPAVVTHSELKVSRGSKGGRAYRVIVRYKYEIDGREYTSDRYDFFMSLFASNLGYDIKRKAVDEMTVGKQVTCLVNPNKHSDAVICRDMFYGHFLFVFFPAVMLLFGILLLKCGSPLFLRSTPKTQELKGQSGDCH